jgi:hypothetical protein
VGIRPRNINISMVVLINIMGITKLQEVPIAKLKIVKLVDQLKPKTELVCPKCGAVPRYSSGYECACGERYGHHSQLRKVVKATGEEVKPQRLIGEKEDVHAHLWKMKLEDFSKYTDATVSEYGVTVSDEMGVLNLKKLLIAAKLLNQVIILTFKDTYEERIALLTVTESRRVVLKEILPLNIADVRETLKVNFEGLTQREIEEAKAFVSTLPDATEEHLVVHDYRTVGVEERTVISEKVEDLSTILEKIKLEAKAT